MPQRWSGIGHPGHPGQLLTPGPAQRFYGGEMTDEGATKAGSLVLLTLASGQFMALDTTVMNTAIATVGFTRGPPAVQPGAAEAPEEPAGELRPVAGSA